MHLLVISSRSQQAISLKVAIKYMMSLSNERRMKRARAVYPVPDGRPTPSKQKKLVRRLYLSGGGD